jgi:NAD(P)-dependent dehydrogenase (short-subunit alcohol dehydrogenase family)
LELAAVIVMTGASGGIGRRLLPELSKSDIVVGVYNRSPPERSYPNVVYRRADLTREVEIEELVKGLPATDEKLTILSLAGFSSDELTLNVQADRWDTAFAVNCRSPFRLTQLLAPKMMQHRWGRIILVSSVTSTEGTIGTSTYSSSKAALNGMNRVFAKELGRFGVTSNLLLLGYFDAGLGGSLPEQTKREVLARIPTRTFGSIGNIVAAVNFLIAAPYVNGSTIRIDGGL